MHISVNFKATFSGYTEFGWNIFIAILQIIHNKDRISRNNKMSVASENCFVLLFYA